jgi:hypothetical protein
MKERLSFLYITDEYSCTQCSATHSKHCSILSIPYLFAAILATIPVTFWLVRPPWSLPWYYGFCILAGEVLLLMIAGVPITLLSIGSNGIARYCHSCGAVMTFKGRHFTKSSKPKPIDITIFCLFLVLNVVLCFFLQSGL